MSTCEPYQVADDDQDGGINYQPNAFEEIPTAAFLHGVQTACVVLGHLLLCREDTCTILHEKVRRIGLSSITLQHQDEEPRETLR